LAIINPSLDDDTGQLWDVSEKPWTNVNAFDTLRTLMVQNRKLGGLFKVVMYTNMEQVSTFRRAFIDAAAKDVHHVPITRIGPDFKQTSYQHVGHSHQMKSMAEGDEVVKRSCE